MDQEILNHFIKEFWISLNKLRPEIFNKSKDISAVWVWHDRPKAIVYKVLLKSKDVYYLKQYKKDTGRLSSENEYKVLLSLFQAFDGKRKLGVIEPIVYLENNNAFVTKEFVGQDLYTFYKTHTTYFSNKKKMSRALNAAELLASWVGCFQNTEQLIEPEKHSYKEVMQWTLQDLSKVQEGGMLTDRICMQIKDKLQIYDAIVSELSVKYVSSNEDAKIWNYLLSDDNQLRALDFVGISIASPAYDVARLWVGLNWLKVFPWISKNKISEIQNYFIHKVGEEFKINRAELAFYKLSVVIEVTAFYSKIREDRYRRKLRNVLFFFLIKRYFKRLAISLLNDAEHINI